MIYFLAVQNTYQSLELALFNGQNCIEKSSLDKLIASRMLIPTLQTMLSNHALSCNDLSFIAANQGPGPFTTLRIVITTVNALNFACNTPLIGIDGLTALVQEQTHKDFPISIALLNAFNRDVYFALQQPHQAIILGVNNIERCLSEFKEMFPSTSIRFIGNATDIYRTEIQAVFGTDAYLPAPMPQTCSLEYIAQQGLQHWHDKKSTQQQLQPLYIKQFSAIMKTQIHQ